MTDILQDIGEVLASVEDDEADSDTFEISSMYILLSRAAAEIDSLRRRNVDLGWQVNPDRSGGQFTQEEIDRAGRGGEGW